MRQQLFYLLPVSLLALAGCCNQTPKPAPAPPPPPKPEVTAELVAANNHAAALMMQFAYADAEKGFAALVEQHPQNDDLQVNQAIALLNRQQPGDTEAALALLDKVLARSPDHIQARYCAGLLLLFQGKAEEAAGHLEAVAEDDPKDAFAAYWLGQSLAEQQKFEEALEQYERAAQLDPYLRSAQYGAFVAMQRLGRGDEAKERLAVYQKLQNNLLAQLAEFKYTRMGEKAEVIVFDADAAPEISPPQGELFAQPVELEIEGGDKIDWYSDFLNLDNPRPTITACDINGDGHLDLFITQADETRPNAVLLGDGDKFVFADQHPLNSVTAVTAVLWGDIDNDGLVDVYLCRKGTDQLWRQVKADKWEDATEPSGVAVEPSDHDGVFLFDADHDGDLDLLLTGGIEEAQLLNNNRDGTFQPIGKKAGLSDRTIYELAIADVDSDRDLDIVSAGFVDRRVYLNNRAWNYQPAGSEFVAFTSPDEKVLVFEAVLPIDLSGRGVVELATVTIDTLADRKSVDVWSTDSAGKWVSRQLQEIEDVWDGAPRRLAASDLDGDGRSELLLWSSLGWQVVGSDRVNGSDHAPLLDRLLVPLTAGGDSLVALRRGKPPIVWPPGKARHPFAQLSFQGRENKADALRSNSSGIGVQVGVRIGSQTSSYTYLRSSTSRGQSLMPLSIGLGEQGRADYIKLLWPDGVMQTEIGVGPGPRTVVETQRQLSSCPVLFCWDGEKYVFVTDLLGVGGMGFAVGRNEYAPSTPRENVLLPPGVLKASDGKLRLKLTEPMEEACYLDSADLAAYDLPPGWKLTIDERMNIAGEPATGDVLFYRRELLPTRAVNDRDDDITSTVTTADLRAAPPGERDHRFLGRTEEHSLVLTFDAPLDELTNPRLVAHGWIEYPYSQTMFAAWQARADYRAPTIDARGEDGEWVTLLDQFGYPAGMPREMSVALPKLPAGCRELRIWTNQEIYWDRLSVVDTEACPDAVVTQLPLKEATTAEGGFPKWTFGPQRVPWFDYQQRTPFWDTRHQPGHYTAFGEMTPLVATRDNAVAIFGPGEEIDLTFRAPAKPQQKEWTRRYVLQTTGWCKDMDLYTKDGDQLGPLPVEGEMSDEQKAARDRLHRQFNTRYRSGH